MFDTNNDGSIDASELKKALNKLGQDFTKEEVKELLDSLDENHNQKLEIDEFVKFLQNN